MEFGNVEHQITIIDAERTILETARQGGDADQAELHHDLCGCS